MVPLSRKIIILVITLFSLSSCNSVFYQPDRQMYFKPEKYDIAYKDIFFKSEDRTRLHAWLLPADKPKGTIIQFHGNAQNLSSHYISLSWLVKHGYNLFIFDYRGYGKSEGTAHREGIIKDGIAAIEYVQNLSTRQRGEMTVVYGQSLGGVIAPGSLLEMQSDTGVDVLILESTFASYQNIARSKLEMFFITWPFQPLAYLLVTDSYAPDGEYHRLYDLPILIIHGNRDKIVPLEFGRDIYTQLENPDGFWVVKGGRHLNTYSILNGRYRYKLIDYLNYRHELILQQD